MINPQQHSDHQQLCLKVKASTTDNDDDDDNNVDDDDDDDDNDNEKTFIHQNHVSSINFLISSINSCNCSLMMVMMMSCSVLSFFRSSSSFFHLNQYISS